MLTVQSIRVVNIWTVGHLIYPNNLDERTVDKVTFLLRVLTFSITESKQANEQPCS